MRRRPIASALIRGASSADKKDMEDILERFLAFTHPYLRQAGVLAGWLFVGMFVLDGIGFRIMEPNAKGSRWKERLGELAMAGALAVYLLWSHRDYLLPGLVNALIAAAPLAALFAMQLILIAVGYHQLKRKWIPPAALLALAATGVGVWRAARDTGWREWSKASMEGKPSALHAYLREHAGSPWAANARDRLAVQARRWRQFRDKLSPEFRKPYRPALPEAIFRAVETVEAGRPLAIASTRGMSPDAGVDIANPSYTWGVERQVRRLVEAFGGETVPASKSQPPFADGGVTLELTALPYGDYGGRRLVSLRLKVEVYHPGQAEPAWTDVEEGHPPAQFTILARQSARDAALGFAFEDLEAKMDRELDLKRFEKLGSDLRFDVRTSELFAPAREWVQRRWVASN